MQKLGTSPRDVPLACLVFSQYEDDPESFAPVLIHVAKTPELAQAWADGFNFSKTDQADGHLAVIGATVVDAVKRGEFDEVFRQLQQAAH